MTEGSQERQRILNMIADGTISAADGVRLLGSLRPGGAPADTDEALPTEPTVTTASEEATREATAAEPTTAVTPAPTPRGKWLSIRVTDLTSGRQRVNVNVPLGVVSWGLRMGDRYGARLPFAVEELEAALADSADHRLIDVEDYDGGQRVEITIQ